MLYAWSQSSGDGACSGGILPGVRDVAMGETSDAQRKR